MGLPVTSERIHDPDAVPYFLWDIGITVRQAHQRLAGSGEERDEILVRLLREANTRDVWTFATWEMIDEAWPRIRHRLGRSLVIWEMMRAHREKIASAVRAR